MILGCGNQQRCPPVLGGQIEICAAVHEIVGGLVVILISRDQQRRPPIPGLRIDVGARLEQ